MSRYFHARSSGSPRRTFCVVIGLLLTISGLGALYPSSSAQADQPTSFSILVNGSTSATISTTGTATLSESGLPSTTVGAITFTVNGDSNCELGLTGLPNEDTSCTAEPFPNSGPGTYVVTATFYDIGDNGNEFTLASSNSATLTISGQNKFHNLGQPDCLGRDSSGCQRELYVDGVAMVGRRFRDVQRGWNGSVYRSVELEQPARLF